MLDCCVHSVDWSQESAIARAVNHYRAGQLGPVLTLPAWLVAGIEQVQGWIAEEQARQAEEARQEAQSRWR